MCAQIGEDKRSPIFNDLLHSLDMRVVKEPSQDITVFDQPFDISVAACDSLTSTVVTWICFANMNQCVVNEIFLLHVIIYLDRFVRLSNKPLYVTRAFRLVYCAIMLSSKMLDDDHMRGRDWANMGHILMSDLNQLEFAFLNVMRSELFVHMIDLKRLYARTHPTKQLNCFENCDARSMITEIFHTDETIQKRKR